MSTDLADVHDVVTPASFASRQESRELHFLRWLPLFLALFSVAISTVLIATTYSVFSQTYDEGAHLACGMQWLDRGTYTFETLHPPLARVATAIFPYLHGERSQGFDQSFWAEGNALLEHNGEYQKNLMLARIGILPFFWLTCCLVWRFMSKDFGNWLAAVTVFFVAFCPVVLGHSSVATTDAPLMAMFLASLLALRALLENAKGLTAVGAGAVIGLASLTKFTELAFLASSGSMLFLYYWMVRKRFPIAWKPLLLSVLVSGLTIWGGYRFSHGPIVVQGHLQREGQEKFAALPSWEKKALLFPYVPADGFFNGLKEARYEGSIGRRSSYLMGQVYDGGRWYFFPVAILVKTQIPMLLFALIGTAWVLFSREMRWSKQSVFLIAGLIGPLLIGIAGSVNIGLRHVLPIYPFLAMLSAVGVGKLWQLRASHTLAVCTRAAVILLLVWNLASCLRAAPDYLAHFNEPATPHASSILVESDLDWGQDLQRLSAKLDELHIQNVSISYFGSANLRKRLTQTLSPLNTGDRPAGWVAISEAKLKKNPEAYGWLLNYPYTRVGHSIRLYYFATPPTA